jgi:hypothetical protein
VEHWNGSCFVRQDLSDLGAEIHLGHCGQACPDVDWEKAKRRQPALKLTVVDRNGIHRAHFRPCVCGAEPRCGERGAPGQTRPQQLLSAGLFPATTGPYPETVFTFALLEEYRILTLHTKMNTKDFMDALQRLTYGLLLGKKTVSPGAPSSYDAR